MDSVRSERLPWVDAARAFSVAAILLLHLNIWVFPPMYEAHGDVWFWKSLSSILGAFRLPVLFALSGFLVADRVRAGWGDRRNLVRAATSYWLYVVWLAVYALITLLVTPKLPIEVSVKGFFSQLVAPRTPLWFIMFLAICVIVVTTLSRLHPSIVLAGTAGVSLLSIKFTLPTQLDMIDRGLYYVFFFALGVYGKDIIRWFGSTAGLWWRAPMTIVLVYVARAVYSAKSSGLVGYFGQIVLRDIAAILCAVTVMAVVCRVGPLARALGFLGSRTLPIYVMHVPLIWALVLLRDAGLDAAFDIKLVRVLGPVLACAFIMGIAIAFHRLVSRWRWGRALFDLPDGVKRLLLGQRGRREPGAPAGSAPLGSRSA